MVMNGYVDGKHDPRDWKINNDLMMPDVSGNKGDIDHNPRKIKVTIEWEEKKCMVNG